MKPTGVDARTNIEDRSPSREEVLDGLRAASRDYGVPADSLIAEGRKRIEDAIAYLETDPAEALAEDYAARMEAQAAQLEEQARGYRKWQHASRAANFGRAIGLREAARMLRDKESR